MTNKEIDPKNIPEISEDYKFLDFEKTIQDISEKITALKNSAIDSSELTIRLILFEKRGMWKQKKYIQSFLFGRQFKLLDILKDLIH
jgi:hypothetical protein